MPAANHKLTTTLHGRTISGTSHAANTAVLTFTDGSKLTIRTAPSASNSGTTGGTVDKIRQSNEPPVLSIDLDGGQTIEIPLAEATSCVLLRDKNNDLEYAD